MFRFAMLQNRRLSVKIESKGVCRKLALESTETQSILAY